MSSQPVVILGTGLAGYSLAREFRKLDRNTELVLVSSDHGGFYSKPTLSNALAEGKPLDKLLLKSSDQMAAELSATIVPNATVDALVPDQKRIQLQGRDQPFGKLVLALGADPIRLPLQGSGAADVMSVNNLDDYRRFRLAIEGRKTIALLGAGLIGCEFANDLISAGFAVHVIDIAPQPLGRLLPPTAGLFMRTKLESAGVVFHFSVTVQSVERSGRGMKLTLSDGSQVEADVVLSAIGLVPRTDLARRAGLSVNRGIVVNEYLQSSSPDIHALGDCAEVSGKVLPFVLPIMHGARALAATLSGKPVPVQYPVMPVAVKTPACPAVVAPPAPGVAGMWTEDETPEGVRAVFQNDQGRLLGFALLGSFTSEKLALSRRMAT